jgi:dipeptidyl aminopeptidase/acylaminoacyl peptidase
MEKWLTRHSLACHAIKEKLAKTLLGLAFGVFLTGALAQQSSQPHTTKSHDSGWYPESVHWSPQGTDLLVTACPKLKKADVSCTLFRYLLAEKRWTSFPRMSTDFIYNDAVYSPDAKYIAAVETGKNCPECSNGIGSRLVLLDAEGVRVRYLTPHGFRIKPTFSKDGKRLLYWSLGLSTSGRTPIGLFDVWELNINDKTERQLTHVLASEIEAPPRYWPDGQRIMLVAGDYALPPNREDFRSKDGKASYPYYGVFSRNGTVVIDPKAPILRPYFYPSEDNWLLALDISPDGKYVIYDNHKNCVALKGIPSSDKPAKCITEPPNRTRVASFAPDSQKVALIWGNSSIPEYSILGTLNLDSPQIEFIKLAW